MSIAQNSFNFNDPIHGTVLAPGFAPQIAVQTFFGVLGAAVLTGQPTSRTLTVEVTYRGYSSQALLTTAIAQVQAKQGQTGTLTVDAINWPNCVFVNFEPIEAPFKEGSGVHGWVQRGKLTWIQISF